MKGLSGFLGGTATLLAVLAALLIYFNLPGTTQAGEKFRLSAKPFVYDPGGTHMVHAAWKGHDGLPEKGKVNHALVLRKMGPTATNATAGAIIVGASGLPYDPETFVVGFDYSWMEGWYGKNAPRFEIQFAGDPKTYRLACADGLVGPVPSAGWRRITFNAQSHATTLDNGVPADIQLPPGLQTIQSITIVFDAGLDATDGAGTPGITRLDNIQILNAPPIGSKSKTKPFKPEK